MTNEKSSIGSLHLLQPGGGGGGGVGWQNTAKYFISPPPSAISKKIYIYNNNNNKVKPLLSGHLRDLNRGCLPNRSS